MNDIGTVTSTDISASDVTTTTTADTTTTTTTTTTAATTTTTTAAPDNGSFYVGKQLEMPEVGEQIAVFETNYGTMKIRLFPSEAPKTVENFTTLILSGYYDGVTFHRVIKDFMIQGGDPEGTGMGGQSCWGGAFADEFSDKLLNLSYSLSMANSGPNTNGSQFFINQAGTPTAIDWDSVQGSFDSSVAYFESIRPTQGDEYVDYMMNMYYTSFCDPSLMSDTAKTLYNTYGGNYYLDGAFNKLGRGHAVFGQVFEGKEVVDAIASVATDENDKPVSPVTITRAYLESWQG